MTNNADNFKSRLSSATGLSESAISAAWPEWWSDEADHSPSAQAELRFSIARKLGLDPTSLFDDGSPRFIWNDAAKYKNFSGDAAKERPAITSFGLSIGRMLVNAVPEQHEVLSNLSASELRAELLRNQPFIRLEDLLALLWGIGVPTIHLRIHPLTAKRMCAMAVRINGKSSILLARDAQYPASITFHIAHEIGHIALGHIAETGGLVDMEDPASDIQREDPEEIEADRYALELLTGDANFAVQVQGQGHNPRQLADEVLTQGQLHQIEPGTLALCYAYASNDWAVAQSALKHIYNRPGPVWSVVNNIANQQMNWGSLSDEKTNFLRAVMGGV